MIIQPLQHQIALSSSTFQLMKRMAAVSSFRSYVASWLSLTSYMWQDWHQATPDNVLWAVLWDSRPMQLAVWKLDIHMQRKQSTPPANGTTVLMWLTPPHLSITCWKTTQHNLRAEPWEILLGCTGPLSLRWFIMSLKLAEISTGKQLTAMTAGFSHVPEDTLLTIIVHLSKGCEVKLDNTRQHTVSKLMAQTNRHWFPCFSFSLLTRFLWHPAFFHVRPHSPSLPQVTVLGRAFFPPSGWWPFIPLY